MAATELKPAYLIVGNDRPKVEVALGRLRARFEEGSVERLVAAGKDGATGADVVAACNAGTLLLGERLVLVTEIDGRRDERGRLSGGWKAPDLETVIEYLGAPAPGTVLCLVAEELKRDSPLAKACQKVGDVLVWEVDRRKLWEWVAKSFVERGIKVERDACEALVETVGEDKLALALEIDKVAIWANGEPVGVDEIRLLAIPIAERHRRNSPMPGSSRRRRCAGRDGLDARRKRATRTRRTAASAACCEGTLGKLTRIEAPSKRRAAKEAASKVGLKPCPARSSHARRTVLARGAPRGDDAARTSRPRAQGRQQLAPELEVQLAVADVARERR